tara:strand:- start:534 stop:1151 length:618 start_codon:yes stop_codon:yes gene_type:complete
MISPMLLSVSLLVLIFDGWPILYKQDRVGFRFKIFKIYKFRTMVKNSGNLLTKQHDRRVTALGKVLRKTKIDELPQLFNILKGDMRFIGPRPEVLEFFNQNNFQFLKNIKPGISDYSSILLRDEGKVLTCIGGDNPYSILLPFKLKLANYYSKKKSFLVDLKLVLITILSILFPYYSSRNLIAPAIIRDLPEAQNFLNKYLLKKK